MAISNSIVTISSDQTKLFHFIGGQPQEFSLEGDGAVVGLFHGSLVVAPFVKNGGNDGIETFTLPSSSEQTKNGYITYNPEEKLLIIGTSDINMGIRSGQGSFKAFKLDELKGVVIQVSEN